MSPKFGCPTIWMFPKQLDVPQTTGCPPNDTTKIIFTNDIWNFLYIWKKYPALRYYQIGWVSQVGFLPKRWLWNLLAAVIIHNPNSIVKGWLAKCLIVVFNNLNSRGRRTIKLVMEEAKSVTSTHDSFMKWKSPMEPTYT